MPDCSQTDGTLPPHANARHMSLLGAAWTVGSLARLAPLAAVHSLTYYETHGWRGLMETADGSPRPELFPSWPNCVFPMFHVFAWLGEGERIIPTSSTDPLRFDGFCVIGQDGRHRWIIANLTNAQQRVRVNIKASSGRVCILDETIAVAAMHAPESFEPNRLQSATSGRIELDLHPYAIARIRPEE